MRFSITLTNQEPRRINADKVDFSVPGFVMFLHKSCNTTSRDDGYVMLEAFNVNKIESVKTLKEPK